MKLLVFEYSSVVFDNSLITEGWHMLKSLLSDLEHISFLDTYFLINENYDSFCFNNCHAIYPDCNLMEWLDRHVDEFDYCLFVAPEDDFIQYDITRFLESRNVCCLVSDSGASFICSSKDLTYHHVGDDILKIKSLKLELDEISYEYIRDFMNGFDFIVKPDNKTSSDLIFHVNSKSDFVDVLGIYMEKGVNELLIQEYVDGEAVSVSVLCDEDYVNCISVNSQVIEVRDNCIEYMGCVTPIEHVHKDRLFSITGKIIENIPGLRGFIGIDYIIRGDEIYFVEVNARLTTPFIVLQEKCTKNLSEQIFKMIVDKKRDHVTFDDKGKFYKQRII